MEKELKLKWTPQPADFPEYRTYINSFGATAYTGLYNNTLEE